MRVLLVGLACVLLIAARPAVAVCFIYGCSPDASPTHRPSTRPTSVRPTARPSARPTSHSPSSHSPSSHSPSSHSPTPLPTLPPTSFPSQWPTAAVTATAKPTAVTRSPTMRPSLRPSSSTSPTFLISATTSLPTSYPVTAATDQPAAGTAIASDPTPRPSTALPSSENDEFSPTQSPSRKPTLRPTSRPTHRPTSVAPTSASPTHVGQTFNPTTTTTPSSKPSLSPVSAGAVLTGVPSTSPTIPIPAPTVAPSLNYFDENLVRNSTKWLALDVFTAVPCGSDVDCPSNLVCFSVNRTQWVASQWMESAQHTGVCGCNRYLGRTGESCVEYASTLYGDAFLLLLMLFASGIIGVVACCDCLGRFRVYSLSGVTTYWCSPDGWDFTYLWLAQRHACACLLTACMCQAVYIIIELNCLAYADEFEHSPGSGGGYGGTSKVCPGYRGLWGLMLAGIVSFAFCMVNVYNMWRDARSDTLTPIFLMFAFIFPVVVVIHFSLFFWVGVFPFVLLILVLSCTIQCRVHQWLHNPLATRRHKIEWRIARRNALWVFLWMLVVFCCSLGAAVKANEVGDYPYEPSWDNRPAHFLRRVAELAQVCCEIVVVAYLRRV